MCYFTSFVSSLAFFASFKVSYHLSFLRFLYPGQSGKSSKIISWRQPVCALSGENETPCFYVYISSEVRGACEAINNINFLLIWISIIDSTSLTSCTFNYSIHSHFYLNGAVFYKFRITTNFMLAWYYIRNVLKKIFYIRIFKKCYFISRDSTKKCTQPRGLLIGPGFSGQIYRQFRLPLFRRHNNSRAFPSVPVKNKQHTLMVSFSSK